VFDYRRWLLEFADLALAECARFEIAGAHSQNETCVEQSGPNWAWSRPVANGAALDDAWCPDYQARRNADSDDEARENRERRSSVIESIEDREHGARVATMPAENRVVIVTGAGGAGCGRSISAQFAKGGAVVVVSDVDEAAGHDTVRLIERDRGRDVLSC
jgi:hypothetical protein